MSILIRGEEFAMRLSLPGIPHQRVNRRIDLKPCLHAGFL